MLTEKGTDLDLAQYIFAVLYLINLVIVLRIYSKLAKVNEPYITKDINRLKISILGFVSQFYLSMCCIEFPRTPTPIENLRLILLIIVQFNTGYKKDNHKTIKLLEL